MNVVVNGSPTEFADGTTVEERPVSVPDLLATCCLALGLDPLTAERHRLLVGALADHLARLDHRVRDHAGEQLDRAQRIVVARNRKVDLIRIAVGVNHGNYRNAQLSGFLSSVKGAEPIALENIAGATYSIQWTGPGTVGPTQRTGTFNAQSQAIDRQQINAFGTYTANVSVTYQGATKQVTASVSVGPAQGTCPP